MTCPSTQSDLAQSYYSAKAGIDGDLQMPKGFPLALALGLISMS